MTIRAYLNLESIQASETDRPSLWNGFLINYHDAEPYIELRISPFDFQKLPKGVGEVTTHFSYHEVFFGGGVKTQRSIGRYRLASATAQVERSRNGDHYLNIKAGRIEDLVNLHREIRAGTIHPAVPFENEQVSEEHFKGLLLMAVTGNLPVH